MSITKILFLLPMFLFYWATSSGQDSEDIRSLPVGNENAYTTSSVWKLVSDADDIRVYRRPSVTSSIDEVRIEATFRTTMPVFLDIISDVSRYSEWVYKCSEARTISEDSGNGLVYYARTAFPWPLQDRDLIIHSTQSVDPTTSIVTSTSVAQPKTIPASNGIVRISRYNSVWKIIPVTESLIRIDYQVTTDPGGILPDWVVNLGITSGPRKTMERLASLVKSANRIAESR